MNNKKPLTKKVARTISENIKDQKKVTTLIDTLNPKYYDELKMKLLHFHEEEEMRQNVSLYTLFYKQEDLNRLENLIEKETDELKIKNCINKIPKNQRYILLEQISFQNPNINFRENEMVYKAFYLDEEIEQMKKVFHEPKKLVKLLQNVPNVFKKQVLKILTTIYGKDLVKTNQGIYRVYFLKQHFVFIKENIDNEQKLQEKIESIPQVHYPMLRNVLKKNYSISKLKTKKGLKILFTSKRVNQGSEEKTSNVKYENINKVTYDEEDLNQHAHINTSPEMDYDYQPIMDDENPTEINLNNKQVSEKEPSTSRINELENATEEIGKIIF